MNCNSCSNCSFRLRWAAIYKDYLKKYPEQKAWIAHMKNVDKSMVCLQEIKKAALKEFDRIVQKVKTARDFKRYSDYIQYLKDTGDDESLEYLSVGEGAY